MRDRFLKIHISDLEHMGGEVFFDKMVIKDLLLREYEGQLSFDNDLYYVYVKQSFFKGKRLSGIAVSRYQNRDYAALARQRLSESYRNALMNNVNNIHKKQRRRIWTEIVLAVIVFLVVCMYMQRAILVAQTGMSEVSFILSILYPVIVALCYILHYRLQ